MKESFWRSVSLRNHHNVYLFRPSFQSYVLYIQSRREKEQAAAAPADAVPHHALSGGKRDKRDGESQRGAEKRQDDNKEEDPKEEEEEDEDDDDDDDDDDEDYDPYQIKSESSSNEEDEAGSGAREGSGAESDETEDEDRGVTRKRHKKG